MATAKATEFPSRARTIPPASNRHHKHARSDLTPAQNARLRKAMQERVHREHKGVVSALAQEVGRAQPTMRAFLLGLGGASFKTAQRFAAVAGRSVLEIIGPEQELPGENLGLSRSKIVAEAEPIPFADLLDWYYASPGVKRCVDEFEDVTLHDIVRLYRTYPDVASAGPKEIRSEMLAGRLR